jgi:hypothetical protein
MLTRPSVLPVRRMEGCEGWKERVVMVSVWESGRVRRGWDGLRVSLG